MSCTKVAIRKLAEQVRGVSYSKQEASTSQRQGYLPVLRAGNITDEGLTFDDLVFVPAERVRPNQRIRKNDVVIAASSGSLDVVGKAARALEDHEAGFGAFCKVLRPGPNVHPEYFAHFFKTREYRRHVSAVAAGININNLRNGDLDEIGIPLPPMSEQRRIARILDHADAVRAKRRVALARLEILTQAIFLEMFGEPARNPKGWPTCTIRDICRVRGGKRLPKGEEYSLSPTPNRYIRVVNLKSGDIDEFNLVYLKPEVQKRIARYTVDTGDVIISIAGSIGLVAAVPSGLAGANLTENAAKLVARSDDLYDPTFLATFLRLPFAQNQIQSHTGQVTIGKLALFRIEKIRVVLPPLQCQQEFARRLRIVRKQQKCGQDSLAKLGQLFASLQHRAFNGEL